MNIYEDLFNEDGSVKDAVVLATSQAITSDTPVSSAGTYVLEGVREADGYPEDFVGKCLLVVSGTTQPLDTNYVLFANSIIWYKSAKDAEWSKDSGYTNAEYDQMADLRAVISQLRNDIATLKDSFNNTMQVKIDGLLDGKGKLKMSIMPDLIQHNRGVYADEAEINKSVTGPVAGDWVINTTTDTVWVYDAETSSWVDSDRKGQVSSVNGKTGDVSIPDIYAVASKGASDLNTIVTQGNYYVDASATNGPAAVDGMVQVYQITGDIIRQVFWCIGTIGSDEHNVYTREFNQTTNTFGDWYQLATSKGGAFISIENAEHYDKMSLGFRSDSDSDETVREYFPFYNIKNGTEEGHGLMVSSDGALVLSGGEAGKTIVENGVPADGTAEQIYLASDNAIYMYVGQDTAFDASSRVMLASNKVSYFPGQVHVRNTEIVKGTKPSNTQYVTITMGTGTTETDAVSNRLGFVETEVDSSGVVSAHINACRFVEGDTSHVALGVKYPLSGTPTGYAPTPANTSDTNDIATTAWVRDRYTISTANPSGGTDGDIWYKV